MVGEVERAERRAGTDCGQPRVHLAQECMSVCGQGLLSFSSGWAGSHPVWRNLWQRDGGQCLNWLCGVMGRLVALLAPKPLGLGRGTAVTLPRGCDQGGGVCFRVLTHLAMPQAAHSAIKSCFGVVKNC